MMEDQRSRGLALHAEDLLLLLNTNHQRWGRRRIVGGDILLRHFDKAEPFTLVDVIQHDVADDVFFLDAQPWDLSTPLDIAYVTRMETGPFVGEDLAVRRYRQVRRPRYALRSLPRYLVESTYLAINRSTGEFFTSLRYLGANRPGEPWRDCPPRNSDPLGQESTDEERREEEGPRIASGVQFAREYAWRVHLKLHGAEIGITVPTTPEGVRALFRLRDYEPGASRRTALVHWVREHARRTKKGTDEEHLSWVRSHLRGSRSFTWNDMQGVVHPSVHDLRRLEDRR